MDNDLISRSATIEWFSPYMHEDEAIPPDVVIGDLKAAPAIDAVEVVRCGECDHLTFLGKLPCCIKHNMREVMSMDDFCSYGERRPDGA